MKISQYIRDKWMFWFLGAFVCFVTAAFLLFMGTQAAVIAAVEVIFAAGGVTAAVLDCLRKKFFYDDLYQTWEELDEKAYLSEVLRQPEFLDGRLLYQILRKNGKYLNDEIARGQLELMEYKDYVEIWAHEVKTPIAAQRLIIENNRTPVTSSLEEETGKIESYVEQMLYYSKSKSLEADYLIQPVMLKQLVVDVIRKYKKMMVSAGVFPKLEQLDYEILTDLKWMEFVFGQIVMNAVKYCDRQKKPQITFSAQESERGMLTFAIADNGIGIPASDVSRVFYKGFTGENGRIYKKSTGMGLYLSKKLCDKMGISLEIRSVLGEGTTLLFVFKQNMRK